MHLYVFYLKQTYPADYIQTLLSDVLNIEKAAIAALTMPGEAKLRFEHTCLDGAEFGSELSIFWDKDSGLYMDNKFRVASKIARYIQNQVVMKYSDNDANEWVLAHKDKFFMAKEIVGSNVGINLDRENMTVLEP